MFLRSTAIRPCQNPKTLGLVFAKQINFLKENQFDLINQVRSLLYQVLANTLGAMHEFAYSKRTLLTLKDDRVIPIVVHALSITENAVLINATRLLSVCAKEGSCRRLVAILSSLL